MNVSSCSINSMNSGSPLARASVGFPVVLLVFILGSTPNDRSTSANCLPLDSFLRTASSSSHSILSLSEASSSFFSFFNNSNRSCSRGSSRMSLGCVNIRIVISISCNSLAGNLVASLAKRSKVNCTSFLQYSPYCAKSSGVKSIRYLPIASTTSVPFLPISYLSAKTAREPPASTP